MDFKTAGSAFSLGKMLSDKRESLARLFISKALHKNNSYFQVHKEKAY